MGETPQNIWLMILYVLDALTLLRHAPHGNTCKTTCPGCRSNKFCTFFALSPPSCRVVMPRCRAARHHHHAAHRRAAHCSHCATRRRRCAVLLCHQSPSSCQVVMPPVAVIVPLIAVLPLAIVVPPVAVVVPCRRVARHLLRPAAYRPADPCRRRVTCHPLLCCPLPLSCCALPSSCRLSPCCPLPSSCYPSPSSCRPSPSSCHPLLCCPLPLSCRPLPTSCSYVVSPVAVIVPHRRAARRSRRAAHHPAVCSLANSKCRLHCPAAGCHGLSICL